MKFNNILTENLYSFEKLHLDFNDFSGTTTIILGKSPEEHSANGAGKSSILKSIFWVLWNKDLRGATLDKIVNASNPDEGMCARIEFEDRGNHFVITRFKDFRNSNKTFFTFDKKPILGSGVEFLVNGKPLFGDTATATQKLIEAKLRMTPRLFLSSVLMAQKSKTSFFTAGDTEKKDILTELLDLKAYTKAFEAVKESIKATEKRIDLLETNIESLYTQIEGNKTEIERISVEEAEEATRLNEKLKTLQAEETLLAQEITELKTQILAENPADKIRESIQDVEDNIARLRDEINVENEAKTILATIENNLQTFDAKKIEVIEKQTSLKTKVLDLSSQITELSKITFKKEELDILTVSLETLKTAAKSLEESIKTEVTVNVNLQQATVSISNAQKEIEAIEHSVDDAKNNALCSKCKRKFQIGESDSLDELIKTLNEDKKSQLNIIGVKEQELKVLETLLKKINSDRADLNENKTAQEDTQSKIVVLQADKQKVDVSKKEVEMLTKQLAENQKDLTIWTTELEKTEKQISSQQKKQIEIKKLISEIQPLKLELTNLESSIKVQREELTKAEVLHQNQVQIKKSITDKETALNKSALERDEITKKGNVHTTFLKRLTTQTDALTVRMDKFAKEVDELQDEMKYLQFWRMGFAPTGIVSFIIDDVIDLLNRKTQDNLNDLMDGSLIVTFDSESKNKKGNVSNQIDTRVFKNGKPTEMELISGGEEQRCIIATELALTEVAESRSGTKLNIRFLDEPFDGIDGLGQEKALTLFSRLARDKDGFFVISHNEQFQNLCQKGIYVLKEKNISRIVDKATFDSYSLTGLDTPASGSGSAIGDRLSRLRKKKIENEEA